MRTSVKTCGICGKTKELSLFYKHPKTNDGRAGKCIDCAKAYTTERRKVTEYASQRRYERKTDVRIMRRKYTKAHQAVWYALCSGRLVRQPCIVCGSTDRIHGHHEDYSKPLEVIWLCPACHTKEHRK